MQLWRITTFSEKVPDNQRSQKSSFLNFEHKNSRVLKNTFLKNLFKSENIPVLSGIFNSIFPLFSN